MWLVAGFTTQATINWLSSKSTSRTVAFFTPCFWKLSQKVLFGLSSHSSRYLPLTDLTGVSEPLSLDWLDLVGREHGGASDAITCRQSKQVQVICGSLSASPIEIDVIAGIARIPPNPPKKGVLGVIRARCRLLLLMNWSTERNSSSNLSSDPCCDWPRSGYYRASTRKHTQAEHVAGRQSRVIR